MSILHKDSRIVRICDHCHQDFQVFPSVLKFYAARFCSFACFLTDQQKSLVVCCCHRCNLFFPITPSEFQRGRGKYCSKTCFDAHQQESRIPCVCRYCHGPFSVAPQSFARGGGKYCQQSCYWNDKITDERLRFWAKVKKTETCWLWTASTALGYGIFGTTQHGNGTNIKAHQYAWKSVGGLIPKGLDVCHTCDIRSCVRNDEQGTYEVDGIALPRWGHLFLGTRAQNLRDAANKGRMRNPRK